MAKQKKIKNHYTTEVKVFSKGEAERKLEILDKRLGKGVGAFKERYKCNLALEGEE